MFSGVHHVAIIANDYEKSKKFYIDVLGFRIVAENFQEARGTYKLDIDAGNCQIELFGFPTAPKRPSYPEACGLRHLAFRVADIEAAVAYLKSSGVAVQEVRIDPYTGSRFAFFEDPDALPLELYEI